MKYAHYTARWPRPAAFALLLALLAGCATPEEVVPPAQLLPKEKLVSLLVQLHILEARVEGSRLSLDSARALFQHQKSELLWKNNVSESDSLLQRSYRYYAVNRKDMDEIYKAVVDSLERRNAQFGGRGKDAVHPW